MNNAAERFWEKVAVADPDDCWEWLAGNKSHKGYGQFSIGDKTRRAHRLAWELTFGRIPEGLHVCHKCDNPGCVNPAHLFLGSNTDNMQDSAKKGRQAKKLTSEKVLQIRELLANGQQSQQTIANDFGVSKQRISAIKQGRDWNWVK